MTGITRRNAADVNLVVDTSVWSLAVRRRSLDPENAYLCAFRAHLDQGYAVLLPGIVAQELLSGVRTGHDFDQMLEILKAVPLLAADRETHILAAQVSNLCRTHGVTVGIVDALVSALCIENGMPLLTADRDFARIAQYANLTLLPPMPTP